MFEIEFRKLRLDRRSIENKHYEKTSFPSSVAHLNCNTFYELKRILFTSFHNFVSYCGNWYTLNLRAIYPHIDVNIALCEVTYTALERHISHICHSSGSAIIQKCLQKCQKWSATCRNELKIVVSGLTHIAYGSLWRVSHLATRVYHVCNYHHIAIANTASQNRRSSHGLCILEWKWLISYDVIYTYVFQNKVTLVSFPIWLPE